VRNLCILLLAACALAFLLAKPLSAQTTPAGQILEVQPGDTWTALGMRFGLDATELRLNSGHMNQAREPAIGTSMPLPMDAIERTGRLVRPDGGGLLARAVIENQAPWHLAVTNQLRSPYLPPFYEALFIPAEGSWPVELPVGIQSLEVAQITPTHGQPLGIRGRLSNPMTTVTADIDGISFVTTVRESNFIGLAGTGAFYPGGQPELSLQVAGQPTWTQPWQFSEKVWDFQSLTLTGEAAQIDQQARDEERARLRAIWTMITDQVQWETPFLLPIMDYLEMSATYGGRRSYNGGPFESYHEGVDFSAYAGTPVLAPAAGTVIVAEPLYVRGGTVIIDHGLGLYSGYYHLSEIATEPGQIVQPGDVLGSVGTSGLSTGNHLHWDLLINGIWVDAMAWVEQDMACWIRTGLNLPCQNPVPDT